MLINTQKLGVTTNHEGERLFGSGCLNMHTFFRSQLLQAGLNLNEKKINTFIQELFTKFNIQ